ncbi:MAG: EamA family transporter [Oscillospiraceae bacterium]|nr:EamA family transporter [Oscillospiraceae bacterium]
MLFLIIAIIANCTVTLVFRATDKKVNGDITMMINYWICTVGAAVTVFAQGKFYVFGELFRADLGTLFKTPSLGGTALLAIVLGLLNGIYYVVNLLIKRHSMFLNGTALTEMFSKVNFIIPVFVAFLLWKETPGLLHLFGIVLAVFGMALSSLDFKGNTKIKKPLLLFSTFLVLGFINTNMKLFSAYSLQGFSDVFVFMIFAVANVMCTYMTIHKIRKNGEKLELKPVYFLYGTLVGIPNFMHSSFMMRSLDTLPAAIVYPTESAGTLLIITVISWLIFKEKLNKKQIVSILLTLAALILINI